MLATRIIRRLLVLATATAVGLAATPVALASAVHRCQPTAQDYYYSVQSVTANRQTSCRLADNFALVYERDVSLQSNVQPYTAFTIGQGDAALQFQLRFRSPRDEPTTVRISARQLNGSRWISFDAGQ